MMTGRLPVWVVLTFVAAALLAVPYLASVI